MEHIAILSKKLNLLGKIVSGEKTIESRWYKFRKPPFECIKPGETVYFKESGDPVSAKAMVKDVLFYRDLNPEKIRELLVKYGPQIGVGVSYLSQIMDKRFCTLVFLENAKKIAPFGIDKNKYGIMCAWITLEDIRKIKKV